MSTEDGRAGFGNCVDVFFLDTVGAILARTDS